MSVSGNGAFLATGMLCIVVYCFNEATICFSLSSTYYPYLILPFKAISYTHFGLKMLKPAKIMLLPSFRLFLISKYLGHNFMFIIASLVIMPSGFPFIV